MNVNGKLARELHEPVIKHSRKEESTRDLKIIFGQQI